jgi:hypothetical protein
MALQKFGSFYIDLYKIVYVKKILPEIKPTSAVQADQTAGVQIGFERTELILYEDDPGYEAFMDWLESQSNIDVQPKRVD